MSGRFEKQKRDTAIYIQSKMKNIDRRSLLTDSVPQTLEQLKSYLSHLDKKIYERAMEWAKQQYKAVLEKIDEILLSCRSKELEVEHHRAVWYQTCVGTVRIKRRQYRDQEGRRGCLLDSLMGMTKYRHNTLKVGELALDLASQMPFRRSAEILRKASAIDLAHQTIWRLVARAADPYLEQAERELHWFQTTGELPKDEGKKVARLFVEADGVMLSLQREKATKTEVKLGVAYEGWERVGKDRYRTVNKTIFGAVAGGQSFWSGLSLRLHRKYDLSAIPDTIVGGDGAGWIKEGCEYINGHFQLDRYHLNRELTTAFGPDRSTKAAVWQACERGDVSASLQILEASLRQATGEARQRMVKAYNYLRDNSMGIGDYRLKFNQEGLGLRHTGVMEGNVDKLVVRRMKNQGMSWTLKGIRRLLCVRFLVLEGNLNVLLNDKNQTPQIQITKKIRHRLVTRLSSQEPDAWIKASMPALWGPHAAYPWVKILKSLSVPVPF
jgi:hypothetical protein